MECYIYVSFFLLYFIRKISIFLYIHGSLHSSRLKKRQKEMTAMYIFAVVTKYNI
jgi:hypothetical protein